MNLLVQNSSNQLILEKLMKTVPFSADDLMMNRNLRYSEDQQRILQPKIDLYFYLSGIAGFVSFCLAFILFMVGQDASQFSIVTAILLIGFGFSIYAVVWSLELNRKLKKGTGLRIVEGPPELNIVYTGTDNEIPMYVLKIKEIKFFLSEEAYHAFELSNYRAYYFPMWRNQLLSIEPLE